ncbi:hypothetical protein ABPG74_012221 [Tetrahymena malaccensis]
MKALLFYFTLFYLLSQIKTNSDESSSEFDGAELFQSQCDLREEYNCVKCKDQFLLGNCKTCPFGYYLEDNYTCQKCKRGEKYCDKNQDVLCFKGFQQIDNRCICENEESSYEWCGGGYDLYYYFFYDQGIIKAKFSDEIQFLTINVDEQYKFSLINCQAINVDIREVQYQCRINPDLKNIFEIIMDIQDYVRLSRDIRFNKSFLSSKNFLPREIIEDPVNSGNHPIYHQIKDISKECKFKQTYYKINGVVTIPKNHFYAISANKVQFQFDDFTPVAPVNQIGHYVDPMVDEVDEEYPGEYEIGEQDQKEGQIDDIGFQRKKNYENIQKGLQNFHSELKIDQIVYLENDNIYRIFILCDYAVLGFQRGTYVNFEIVQSYEITFKVDVLKDGENLIFQISIQNEISKFKVQNKDQIEGYLKINHQEQSLQIFDSNFLFHGDNFKQEVKANEFLNGKYSFEVGIKYFLDKEIQNKQKGNFEINNQNQMQLNIANNNFSNMNINESILIQSQVSNLPLDKDYEYFLSCQDLLSQQKCENKMNIFGKIPLDYYLEIPSGYLKPNNQYSIRFYTQFNKFKQILFDEITFKTGKFNFDVVYDDSYITQTVIFNQILSFEINVQNKSTQDETVFYKLELIAQGFESVYSQIYQQNSIQFRLEEYIPLVILQQIQHVNIIFYAIDPVTQEFTKTQQHEFKIRQPPHGCLINIQNKEQNIIKAFQDEIQLDVQNCMSQNEGHLQFQFMYFHSIEEYQNELNHSKQFERNYLTKLSPSSSVKTVLPEGQIFIFVIVQDKHKATLFYQIQVEVQQATLDKTQYQQFFEEQMRKVEQYTNDNQIEEMLFTFNMMAECIVDIENKNQIMFQDDNSLILLKDMIEQKLNMLSSQFNYDNYLQEFIIRIYNKLYNQFANKYQQKNVFLNIQNIFENIKEQSRALQQISNDLQEQFQRQFYSSLNLIHKLVYDKNNQINQNLQNWQDQYIHLISDIADELALTLRPNQKNIEHDFQDFKVKVGLQNKTEVLNNYLSLTQEELTAYEKFETKYLEIKYIYWKENIYFDDDQFLQIYSSQISKIGIDEVKSKIQIYPSILISISESMKKYDSDLNRLLFQKEKQLTQKLNLTIRYDFEDIQNNKEVKCIQKVDSIWTTEYCSKVIKEVSGQVIVSCECKSLSFTTLISDLDYLISQDNFQNSINGEGIEKISSFQNWYQAGTIYVMLGINIMFVLSLIIAKQADQKSALYITSHFLVSLQTINSQSSDLLKQNEKKNSIAEGTPNQGEEKKQEYNIKTISQDEENSTKRQNHISEISQNQQSSKEIQIKDDEVSSLDKQKQSNKSKMLFQQYIKSISKFRAIGLFHSLFSIFLLYNKKKSSSMRICNYYCKLIWKLAINITFGKELTLSQIMIISIISSCTFAIYQILFILINKKKKIRCLSYIFCFLFSLYSYYLILVSLANSSISKSNSWILIYACTLFVSILFLSMLSSALKLCLAYKLVGYLDRKNIFLKFIGASLILQELNDC